MCNGLDELGVDFIARQMRALYDREARNYVDTTSDFVKFPGLQDELDRFLARIPPAGLIMDLGCGAGRDALYMAEQGRRVLAVDFSWSMLSLTRRALVPLGSEIVHLVQADARFLPVTTNGLSGVWACACLLHLPSDGIMHAVAEIFRTLEAGGAVAISMKAGHGEGWRRGSSLNIPRWFTQVDPNEFCAMLQLQGFDSVRWVARGRRDWFVAEAIRAGSDVRLTQ